MPPYSHQSRNHLRSASHLLRNEYGSGIPHGVGNKGDKWSVYKSCKEAPESFSNISVEVLSLHAVLKEVEELLADQPLSTSKQHSLATVTHGCQNVLEDLQALTKKYESLGSKSKKTWDRMRWGSNDIAELRQRLTSNTVLLTAFMSTFPVVVERKLNSFIQEFRDGKREASVISVASIESLTIDDKQMWREIRKELEGIGISVAAFDANKGFILQWFQRAIENGSFEEEPVDGASDTDTIRNSCNSPASSEHFVDAEDMTQEQNVRTSTTLHHAEPPHRLSPQSRNIQPLVSAEHVDNSGVVSKSMSDPAIITSRMKQDEKTKITTKSQLIHSQDASTALVGYSGTPRKTTKLKVFFAWIRNLNASFLEACEKGDIEAATRLLEKGVDVNARSGDGEFKTALGRVCATGTLSMAKFLLDNGADVNAHHLGGAPLLAAVRRREPDLVRLLCNRGASNLLISAPRTLSDSHESTQMARMRLHRLTALGSAVVAMLKSPDSKSQEITRMIIRKAGGEICYPDVSALLHHVIRRSGRGNMSGSDLDIVQLLLLTGTDVNKAHGNSSSTPLIEAAKLPDHTVIRTKEQGKPHLNRNKRKYTTLNLLLEKRPELERKDKDGYTALDHAMSNTKLRAAETLIAAGAVNNFQKLRSHPIRAGAEGLIEYEKILKGYLLHGSILQREIQAKTA